MLTIDTHVTRDACIVHEKRQIWIFLVNYFPATKAEMLHNSVADALIGTSYQYNLFAIIMSC